MIIFETGKNPVFRFRFRLETGTGTGNITSTTLSSDFDYPGRSYQIFWNIVSSGASLSGTSALYINVSGVQSSNSSETPTTTKFLGSGTFSKFYAYISASTTTATATFTVRNKSIDTALTFNVGAASTGEFSDVSNSFSFESEDDINYEYHKPTGSGSMTLRWITSLVTLNSEFTPQVRYY